MATPLKAMNYIDGRWVWPEGVGTIASLNPADRREVVCEAPDSPESELAGAAAAAARAFPAWRRTPPPARAAILRRAGEILRERKQAIGEVIAREAGKPLAEGCGDVQEAIDMPRGLHYENVYQLEDGVPADIVEGLKKLGHRTAGVTSPLGGGQAIWIDWDKGTLTGGSDPRKDGCALGY